MNFRNMAAPAVAAPTAGSSSGEWIWCGWIKDDPACHALIGITYEELQRRALRSDHGEERLLVDRADGSGVNCFYRETNVKDEPSRT
jgi:hypothetical protein